MQRRQKVTKKHPPTTRPSPSLYQFAQRDTFPFQSRPISEDTRQQLRAAIEELEHSRLTSDLQIQKRLLLQQQLKNAQQQNEEYRVQNEQLRKQLSKLSKKYSKVKDKKECTKCKNSEQLSTQIEKERQIYVNDRKMMQDQIKSLKVELESSETTQQRDSLLVLTDSLHKEIQLSSKKVEQQTRVIHFLNDKLSQFEMQNIEIMKKVELLEGKLSQIQIDSIMQKKRVCPNCSNRAKNKPDDTYSSVSRSRQRRNGSIQNVRKTQRDEFGLELQRYEP